MNEQGREGREPQGPGPDQRGQDAHRDGQRGPDHFGPDQRGPEGRGPQGPGPDHRGQDAHRDGQRGPEHFGPDQRGPEGRGPQSHPADVSRDDRQRSHEVRRGHHHREVRSGDRRHDRHDRDHHVKGDRKKDKHVRGAKRGHGKNRHRVAGRSERHDRRK